MTQPAFTQGASKVLDALAQALTDHLAEYLAVWSADTGRTMPAPGQIWRGDVLPANFNSPWLSLYSPDTAYDTYSPQGEWRVSRTVVVFILLKDGDVQATGTGAEAMSSQYMYQTMLDYGQAVTQCLEYYGSEPGYGGAVGVIDVSPAGDAEIVPEPMDRGAMVKFFGVRLIVSQRVRGKIGAPPPPLTP